MLFALFDYLQYRLRKGPYGPDQDDAAMGVFSHYGEVPEHVIEQLRVGDFVYTQRLDSYLSWAIMYFASSSIDHCAVYAGNGEVGHMTLGGTRKHSLNAVARGARVLLVRPTIKSLGWAALKPREDGGYLDRSPRFFSGWPPKLQFACGGIQIAVGIYPDRWKWQFLADIGLLALAIDLPTWLFFHFVAAFPLAGVAALVTLYNMTVYWLGRTHNKPFEIISHPDIGYRAFFQDGGIIFGGYDTYVIGQAWGIVPLGLFQAFLSDAGVTSKGPDDGSPDILQEIGKRVRDVVKSGDFMFLPIDAEDEDGDEIDHKK